MEQIQRIDLVIEKLIDALSPYLLSLGFVYKKKRNYLRKLEECDQGLIVQFRRIKGEEAGYLEVCPNVIFEKVQKVSCYLKGEQFKKGWPTIAGNIGNFQPERKYIEWPLTLTSDPEGLSVNINKTIESIANPLWDEYSQINELIEGYENNDPRLSFNGHGYVWKWIAAYCVINERDKAIKTLDKWIVGRPNDLAVQQCLFKINNIDISSIVGGRR